MKKVTSQEVYTAIRAAHPNLIPFGSYTAPTGETHNPSNGVIQTSYGFPDAAGPIVMVEDRWDIDPNRTGDRTTRHNEHRTCWLIFVGEHEE